jgi:HDIG domain protein
MDYQTLIDKYYTEDNCLRNILLMHSRGVADLALSLARRHPEMSLDLSFIEEAAMLHDIGIIRCNAPGIYCFGTEPYLCHGRIGADMLRAEGFARHARVCERHTGAGITKQEIIERNLPLPQQDFLPETLEEQLICYADKFFSKTHLERKKNVTQAADSLAKFGADSLARFQHLVQLFGAP